MFRLSATLRLAIGLACLGISVFLASRSLGLGHDEWGIATRGRVALSESIAMHVSNLVSTGDLRLLEGELNNIVERNPDLHSVGLRSDDLLILEAGNHRGNWAASDDSVDGQVHVPIYVRNLQWGRVELRFAQIRQNSLAGLLQARTTRQLIFVLCLGTILYSFYLSKMLNHLDPSKVIPDRVRAALDTFAEGLLVLDRNSRIVLANRAFSDTIGEENHELQGRLAVDLPWSCSTDNLPWKDALADGIAHTGRMVDLRVSDHRKINYMVNASPILSDNGELQGVLASFDDITLHEQRKRELERTLRVLGESREQIRKQNEELKVLATRDPLTGCMNRRSFYEAVETLWQRVAEGEAIVATLMVDVDHFKLVNDNHGHSAGDEVLRVLGRTLTDLEGPGILPCRYGGEEFCVTLEGYDEEQAREYAEEIRLKLEAANPAGIPITASLGVAVADSPTDVFQDTLDRADQSLYVAKRRGRNRVVCINDIVEGELEQPEESSGESEEAPASTKPTVSSAVHTGIPFHAVTALISALSYRDAATAEHSRRVADLCVMMGSKLLSVGEQYVLETAALLHDIGKIGTPDSVLLKPGPLSEEERDVMSHHDVIGIEIVRTAFANDDLISIVSNHFSWYGGHPMLPEMPTGEDIPIGARILCICDTYDAIVTDRVYRPSAPQEDAFAELRRCAGDQFDPALVELFIDCINNQTARQRSEHAKQPNSDVSKQTAVRIGLIMDSMTQALANGDCDEVTEQAERLSEAAMDARLTEIAMLAAELKESAGNQPETDQLTDIAASLLDLCRTTQKAYLGVSDESRRQREAYARKQFDE